MLLKHLPVGYAYHRIIVDADGKPLDSIILEVNPVFEEITGLTKKEVVGKKATELHYTFNDPAFNWICEYGRFAKSRCIWSYDQR